MRHCRSASGRVSQAVSPEDECITCHMHKWIQANVLASFDLLYIITACQFEIGAMKGLTARQQEILDLIRDQIAQFGRPPTRAEIARQLGFRSANAAEDHLQALAKKNVIALDASTSRGIRLLGEYAEGLEETASKAAERAFEHFMQLPLIGRVAAGSPILAQEHVEKQIPVDPSLFPDKPDYLLKVRGMSMKDIGIMDGDLLAVKKASTARAGQVVVARVNDDVTVKRFFQKGHVVELQAENSDFAPIEVDLRTETFAIEGLAVGLIRQGQLH
ncbi:LexA repressor [Limnobacter sp. 130]|jgi:repressor LexA|nr:LexA repressor [Limnobacter sp. 130]